MGKSFKDQSKLDWQVRGDLPITNEQIQIGCLQRIADATEVMAKNYIELFAEKEKFRRWYQDERDWRESLERSLRTHKGNYTRVKNELESIKRGKD